ncbi:MAG: hypothetical protein HGA45_41455 [Chloroflexales bacterium]|nr:hypothetical protein [Chloroflexales bacterium]
MDLSTPLLLFGAIGTLLVTLNVFTVLRYTLLARHDLPRWADFVPALALVAMLAHANVGLGMDILMILLALPLYLATIVLFLATLVRVFQRRGDRRAPAARFRWLKAAGALVCAALVLLSAVRQTEMYGYTWGNLARYAVLSQPPHGADLSDQSWSQAFVGLVAKLKAEYPFTAHKGIDWDTRYAAFAPRIAAAEQAHDAKAYYHALREFAWSINDPHVDLEGDDGGLAEAEVGGSFGLTLLPLDDGRLAVSGVAGGDPARAGMRPGAEIVAWNGVAATEALAQTSIIWSEYAPSTREGLRLQQARFLTRGPVGATAAITFRNSGEATARTVALTAVASELTATSGPGPSDLVRSSVESRVLPSGYGYIRVRYELPTLRGLPDALVQQAVAGFAAAKVPGIIVDVRNNFGGEEGLASRILTPFYGEERLMHYLGMVDPAAGVFRPYPGSRLAISPVQAPYQGPVAVLIDNYSHSAAEDIAFFLQNLPNGIAVGLSGTAGGGGASAQGVALPGGYTFVFPKAQQLDDAFAIELEGDGDGNGGVEPDVRMPADDATAAALGAGRDVALEQAEATLNAQATSSAETPARAR